MARGKSVSIDIKIERQKQAVSAAKEKYETALEELNQLMKKRKELQSKELLKAFENSDKSLEEVVAFMTGETKNEG